MRPPSIPDAVRIVEVSPRDGLQNIAHQIPTSTKVELISRLSRTGVHSIELTSIVSPRAVPQLADCRELLRSDAVRHLQRRRAVDGKDEAKGGSDGADADANTDTDAGALRLPVLVPNVKGLEIALAHGVGEVAVFVSATEGFSRANINCSVEEGLERAVEVARIARKKGVAVRGYISSIFTDPITNSPTPFSSVHKCATTLLAAGVYEVSLGDTTGTGTPSLVRSLLTYLTTHEVPVPVPKLGGHFHDSHGRGLENVWEAYLCGVRVYDSSVAGLGGCPFAPGAKGNVATEEVVGMFEGRGVRTGVDARVLGEVARWSSKSQSSTISDSYELDRLWVC
ncbi:hypothetical protein BJX68DRAFT_271131 [Aspergillus pseudodeflectus]|uniref:hydroxymethylglutaryl-CoA lyase n=1 Tax=Aspergillus pseudodeflectus TaxID=176178 RepID=A0ABR4JNA9_9EURO